MIDIYISTSIKLFDKFLLFFKKKGILKGNDTWNKKLGLHDRYWLLSLSRSFSLSLWAVVRGTWWDAALVKTGLSDTFFPRWCLPTGSLSTLFKPPLFLPPSKSSIPGGLSRLVCHAALSVRTLAVVAACRWPSRGSWEQTRQVTRLPTNSFVFCFL